MSTLFIATYRPRDPETSTVPAFRIASTTMEAVKDECDKRFGQILTYGDNRLTGDLIAHQVLDLRITTAEQV